jgi:hypothetical protein
MKNFVVVALLALAFAGCVSNELPDSADVVVEFGAKTGTQWNHAVSGARVVFFGC